jgi:hypothetical protein
MTIVKKVLTSTRTIDLDGPDGNAFILLGIADTLGNQLDYDVDAILSEMKSGSYINLVQTFESYFGDIVTLETTDEELLEVINDKPHYPLIDMS